MASRILPSDVAASVPHLEQAELNGRVAERRRPRERLEPRAGAGIVSLERSRRARAQARGVAAAPVAALRQRGARRQAGRGRAPRAPAAPAARWPSRWRPACASTEATAASEQRPRRMARRRRIRTDSSSSVDLSAMSVDRSSEAVPCQHAGLEPDTRPQHECRTSRIIIGPVTRAPHIIAVPTSSPTTAR